MTAPAWESVQGELAELAPVLRRCVALDRGGVARVRAGAATVAVYVRLPFGVLVSRTVPGPPAAAFDATVHCAELLAWLDATTPAPPPARDAEWRAALPPAGGWQRIDTVPDAVVRDLVRAGALALQDAAARDGLPGAQPRAEVADALLDSVVLTVTDDAAPNAIARITLRTLSALTRMGFLARGSHAHVDLAGRWTRVVGSYGTVYAEAPGGLTVRTR